jgi:hypothetical protein
MEPRESLASQDDAENLKAALTTPNRHSSPLLDATAASSRYSRARYRKNQLLKHSQYIAAPLFWYHFRENLPVLAVIVLLIAFTVPWFTPTINDINEFFLSGAVISILGSLLVMISYYQVIPWRRHPSKLLLLRSMTNCAFSVLVIVNVSHIGVDGHTSCDVLTFLNQFTVLAGELWVFTIAIDLKRSITNPFSNYINNINFYHYLVWVFALVNAAALLSVGSCHKQSQEGFCWIDINAKTPSVNFRSCLWGFFLSWIIICYVSAVLVVYFSHRKISSGLESTYRAREGVIFDTFRVVFLFLAYAVFVVFLFLLERYLDRQGLREFLSFTIGCRGFLDTIVWFSLHDFQFLFENDVFARAATDSQSRNNYLARMWDSCCCIFNRSESGRGVDSFHLRRSTQNSMQAPLLVSSNNTMDSTDNAQSDSLTSYDPPNMLLRESRMSAMMNRGGSIYSSGRLMISDLDLTPQLNKELRKEVVSSVTEGIITTIRNWTARTAQLHLHHQQQSPRMGSDEHQPKSGDGSFCSSSVLSTSYLEDNDNDHAASLEPQSLSPANPSAGENGANIHRDPTTKSASSSPRGGVTSGGYSNYDVATSQSISMRGSRHTLLGSGFHSVVHTLKGSLLGHHAPGEYGEDYNARVNSFIDHNASNHSQPENTEGRLNALQAQFLQGPGLKHSSSASSLLSQVRGNQYQHHTYPHQPNPQTPQPQRSSHLTDTITDSLSTVALNTDISESDGSVGSANHGRAGRRRVEAGAKASIGTHDFVGPTGVQQQTYAPAEVVFDLDEKHRFRDFRPATFQTLRYLADVTDEWYTAQLLQPAKEQLTEGASDAFLFYSGGLIVKTVTHRESRVLLSILDEYREHLRNNPESLLVRFFGLHALTFYGKEFIFVVMKNIFPTSSSMLPGGNLVINERFDIKGSWINRSAQLPPPGKRKICRHCATLFTVGSNDRCPEIVGLHEANVVFKDNDLSQKIRLSPLHAISVLEALNKDSDALCRMGIMDYSLLIGVQNATYDVDQLLGQSQSNGCSYTEVFPGRRVTSTLTSRQLQGSIGSSADTVGESGCDRSHAGVPFSFPNMNQESEKEPRGVHTDLEEGGALQSDPLIRDTGLLTNAFTARAVVAPSMYYLGIVDILQTWDASKRVENLTKVHLKCQSAQGISCIAPEPYKHRFQKKVHTFVYNIITRMCDVICGFVDSPSF